MVERPNVRLTTWAGKSKFVQDPSEIIEKPTAYKFAKGWELGEKPSHKDFNYLWYQYSEYAKVIDYLGILPWNPETKYKKFAVVIHNAALYYSKIDNNQGNNPTESSDWHLIQKQIQYLHDVEIDIASHNLFWNCADTIACDSRGGCANFVLKYDTGISKWVNKGAMEVPPVLDFFPESSEFCVYKKENDNLISVDLDTFVDEVNAEVQSIRETKNLKFKKSVVGTSLYLSDSDKKERIEVNRTKIQNSYIEFQNHKFYSGSDDKITNGSREYDFVFYNNKLKYVSKKILKYPYLCILFDNKLYLENNFFHSKELENETEIIIKINNRNKKFKLNELKQYQNNNYLDLSPLGNVTFVKSDLFESNKTKVQK